MDAAAYLVMQKALWKHWKLAPGSKVKVTRAASSGDCGWDNHWTTSMDEKVGETLTIARQIHSFPDWGVRVEEDKNLYPIQVFEPVLG